MSKTYRTFKEIQVSAHQCEWRWDGAKMELRAIHTEHYKEWTLIRHTTLDDLLEDASIIETTSLTLPLPELQNWLIYLDDNDSSTLIGALMHKIESSPEMTITQFVEEMKALNENP